MMADAPVIKQEAFEKVETNVMPPTDDQARWMFSYRELYWDIKAKLMGGELTQEQIGPNKGKYIIVRKEGLRPFMNDIGVDETMALFNANVSKIQALSQFNEERIIDLCRFFNLTLPSFFMINRKKFQITRDHATQVMEMLMLNYEANLRKSIGGQGMRIIGGTERVITTQTDGSQRHKLLGII